MTDDMPNKKRKELYRDPFLTVAEHVFEHEGEPYRYFIKEEPQIAVVGAVTAEGDVVMVRQFRPGPGIFLFDVPGGMVDDGDTPLEAARRELLEETGYAGDLEEVARTFVTAYSTAYKHIFVARNCVKVADATPEPNMIAEPVLVSPDRFGEIMRSGDVVDLDCMLLLAKELGID